MTDHLRFKISALPTHLRESARTWNRCNDLRDRFKKDPTAENSEQLEQAAIDWFEASARAGRRFL